MISRSDAQQRPRDWQAVLLRVVDGDCAAHAGGEQLVASFAEGSTAHPATKQLRVLRPWLDQLDRLPHLPCSCGHEQRGRVEDLEPPAAATDAEAVAVG